ncbi:MAG: hypothetical protein ABWY22_05795 [Flavobacterium sp.]
MIKKVYHYLYYRTYEVILKTNKTSSESSSARFLSILFLINIITVYSIFFNKYNNIAFYICCIVGIGLSIFNLVYFNDAKNKSLIFEFKDLKIKSGYKYLVDIYPYVSALFLLISIEVSYTALFYYLGILVLIKLVSYFWNA